MDITGSQSDRYSEFTVPESLMVSQTNGDRTTMAMTSANGTRSQNVLEGVGGLRPTNLFHRDEMF